MSDTPRTDLAEKSCSYQGVIARQGTGGYEVATCVLRYVESDFARQLEREAEQLLEQVRAFDSRHTEMWLKLRAAEAQNAELLAALREIDDLCRICDVDETTEAYGWGAAIANVRALLAKGDRDGAKMCVWSDSEGEGNWDTGCGRMFDLNNGTPVENEMHFCTFCGGSLQQVTYAENEAERAAAIRTQDGGAT
jgi:hypothetical protein